MLKNQTQLAKQEAKQLFIEHCKTLSIPKSFVIVQSLLLKNSLKSNISN